MRRRNRWIRSPACPSPSPSNATAKADYAQANIEFQRSRLALAQLQENITLEIKVAVSNLDTDLKSIEARRIARELAGENLRNQQARYDVGLATTKDLLDFQNLYTLSQLQEVQALTQYNSDLAELRRVEGTLLEARNVVVESETMVDRPWWAKF
jgi:outer membrane protein TolC